MLPHGKAAGRVGAHRSSTVFSAVSTTTQRVKAMQAEIAAALRRTGAYLSHLGRLKLGVATSAREEAPPSGVKI